MRRVDLLRRFLPAAAGLMLAAAACSGSVASAQDIQGLLKAVEGKELVIQLDDGSTMRVQMKDVQATPEVNDMVGHEVKATVRSSKGGVRDLVKVERDLVNDDSRGRGRGEGRGRGGDDLLREDRPRDAEAEDLHFSGIIESISPDAFVIGGKTFQVNSATELDEGLVKGVEARVEFLAQPDGSLLATEIETDADDDLANDRRGRGLGDAVRTGEDRSGPNRGPGEGEARMGEEDDRRGPNRGPGEGEIRGIEDEVRGAQPEVRGQEPEARGQGPEARAVEDLSFSGLIEAMSADSLVIGGKTFKVNNATKLDNGLAKGVMARVEFVTLPDGSLLATEIETDAPDEIIPPVQPQAGQPAAPEVGENAAFSGLIEAMSADSFVIGGKTFKVDGATKLDNGLAKGVMARVEFVTQPDGSLLATEIETDAPDEVVPQVQPQAGQPRPAPAMVEDSHFSGLIEAMSANSFVIGGKTFKVDGATELDNGLAVGVLARVEFITLPDGSLLANEIETDAPDKAMPQAQPQAAQAQATQASQPAPASQTPAVVQDFHFSGPIQSMGAGTWVIGGRTFKVDGSTVLDTGLAVGVVVDVEFTVLPDGTFKAIKIETLISGKNK